jgi:hypothetical protein
MGKTRWAWGIVLCCAAGCGQDLALPDGYGKPPEGAGGAGRAEGITGAGGAGGAPTSDGGGGTPSPPKPSTAGAKGGAGGASEGGGGAGGRVSVTPSEGGEGESRAGSGGEGGATSEVTPPPQLLLSEYVEGTKSNKALEIFALRGGSLEGCELQTYFNGKTEPAKLALQGELATGATYVLCSKELAEAEPTRCTRTTNLTFNGDDALALVCGGVVQDLFGELGVDPGESWGMGATLDHTLQRRCEVTAGRTDASMPFGIDAEWVTFDADTFSGLGQRGCD